MPTVQEWQNALTVPRILRVDSSQALADNINAKPNSRSFMGVPKFASGVSEFAPPRRIRITASELLYHIGRVTAPRINNLADLCSTWARARYIWAFAPDPTISKLRLSQEAMTIDFHQKGLLSDEVGVGMAALIMEKYFSASEPVDVSVAIRADLIPGLRLRTRASPDYVFRLGIGDYAVVECKGSRSGAQAVLQQLKRGTEQVVSLAFPSGYSPTTFIIGTSLSREGTNVYVVDPPATDEHRPVRRPYSIRNEVEFRSLLEGARLANLFYYVGASGRAAKLGIYADDEYVHNDVRDQQDPPLIRRIDQIREDFVGVEQSVSLVGQSTRLRVFQGVAADVYTASIESNEERRVRLGIDIHERARGVAAQIRKFAQYEEQSEPQFGGFIFERSNTALRTLNFGRDGTILEIEIS